MEQKRNFRLLLIEDDEEHALIISRHLRRIDRANVEMVTAATLADGFRYLRDASIDAVLLDLRLPDSDIGETLTRVLAAGPSAPIIVLSSLEDRDLVRRSLHEGAQDYLCKAELSSELLLRAIEHAVERNALMRERTRVENALRESEQRFRAMADETPVMIWVTDAAGGTQFVNRAYCDFFGVDLDQVRSGTWQPLLHPDDEAGYRGEFQRCLQEQRPFRAQTRVRRADGQWRWVDSHGLPRFSAGGEFLGVAGSSPDVTERREAEEALRVSDQRKDQFLAMLSHELRNPLAAIRTSSAVLERVDPGSESARRAQAVIGRQVSHLARLVDDLLEVTRITRGKVQLQRTRLNLNDLIARTMEDHREIFAGAQLTLRVSITDDPLWVNADATRLMQIVGNLLQNAVKFTPQGGEVAVSLQREGERATLQVRDSGIGIPSELLPRIFEPFTQADATLDRSRGGLGLGLALVKGLVDLHGGTVQAISEGTGKGTTMRVLLPVEASPGREATPPVTAPASGRRVLIIEDNVDAADSLCGLLELSGHEVSVAYTGPQGLVKARQFRPEVVFCDIGLPQMDGYDVARAFCADETLRSAYLVALSGYARPEDVERARNAGFREHVAKPPNIDRLMRILEKV